MTTPNKTSQYGPSPFYPQSVRPRLLVVDDQPANIQALYQIFQTDHEVFMATTGQQALGVCRQVLPDLILLDIMMPDMDGLEVCRQLKADPATTHIPVIFVTGQSEPTDEALALEVGGVDLIHKPVNSCVVRARVQTHLTLKVLWSRWKHPLQLDSRGGIASACVFLGVGYAGFRATPRYNGKQTAVAFGMASSRMSLRRLKWR